MKKISLIVNRQTLSAISAIFLASLIFSIFFSNQKVSKYKQPIYSKYTLKDTGKQRVEIGYKNKKPEYIEGQILVKYKDDKIKLKDSKGETEAKKIRESKSVKKIKSIKRINTELVEITDGKSVKDKVEELKKDSRIENAEPNYIYYSSYTPDDTEYGIQWALENTGQEVKGVLGTSDADMDVAEMWDIETDHSEDIVVAVIDSGVALNHPDISGNIVTGYDALTDGVEEPYDNSGHGSHVAGIIASIVNNTTGMSGISRFNNVKIMPIRAGEGGGFTMDSIIASIEYATNNGADIINMSLAGYSYSQLFEDALASFPGLVVAAASNEGIDNDVMPAYPASYDLPNIISVAATDQNDDLAEFSNYGETSVDVGAPGVNIYSLEGYQAFKEDFESVVEPDFGTQFSQLGVGTNWGTFNISEIDNTIIFADINYISSGSYAPNANSYLTSSSVNIGSSLQSYVSFDYYCDIPDTANDFLSFEVFDGNNWTIFASYTGTGGGLAEFDVTAYKATDFQLRFNWQTDAVSNEDYLGCYVDNIKIVDTSSSQGSYQYNQGTSMACPYAAAVAAVVWGKNPTISVDVLKNIILGTGDSVVSLSDVTLTGKRINAYNAYSANPEDYKDYLEPPEDTEDTSPGGVVFHPDKRCHWEKPSSPTWVKLEPKTENGVSGMMLTWTQYDADKINIKIDDGTGNYPWKIENTLNDGHEFLANVQSWQNIMIKPINHCKEGDYGQPVSFSAYPHGWYSVNNNLASASSNTLGVSTKNNNSNVLGTTTETQSQVTEETPMVPDTGGNDLIFITTSLSIVGFATYFILDDRSRKIALRGFEKKSSKNI